MKFTLSLALAVCSALNAAAAPVLNARQDAALLIPDGFNADLTTDVLDPVYVTPVNAAVAYIPDYAVGEDVEVLHHKLARRQTPTAASAAVQPAGAVVAVVPVAVPSAAVGDFAGDADDDADDDSQAGPDGPLDAGLDGLLDSQDPVIIEEDDGNGDEQFISNVPIQVGAGPDGNPALLVGKKERMTKLHARQDPTRENLNPNTGAVESVQAPGAAAPVAAPAAPVTEVPSVAPTQSIQAVPASAPIVASNGAPAVQNAGSITVQDIPSGPNSGTITISGNVDPAALAALLGPALQLLDPSAQIIGPNGPVAPAVAPPVPAALQAPPPQLVGPGPAGLPDGSYALVPVGAIGQLPDGTVVGVAFKHKQQMRFVAH